MSSRPLTRRISEPRACSSIVSQIPNAVQSIELVERQHRPPRCRGPDGARSRPRVPRARRCGDAAKSSSGSISPNDASHRARGRVQPHELRFEARHCRGLRDIRLRDDDRVRGRDLLQRLVAAQAVLARRPSRRSSRGSSDAAQRARSAACRRSAPARPRPWSRSRPGESEGSRRESRRSSRSRSSSDRSPRSEQQTQPLASRTVRSSTRRSRWWSIPTSPSSFTITAVSPSSGCCSSRATSVVLPLPRNPVTRTTGVFTLRAPRAGRGRAGRAARPRGAPPPTRARRGRRRPPSRPCGRAGRTSRPHQSSTEQAEVLEHRSERCGSEHPAAGAVAGLRPVLLGDHPAEGTH